MAINEAQVPLPTPPTGVDETQAVHPFNPENGHYQPSLLNGPQNVNQLAPLVAAAFLAVAANTAVWFYAFVFANTQAVAVDVTLTEPGGNTYIVTVPGDDTVTITSTPEAPLFVSRTAGNITIIATIATVQVTATYTVK